jgi:long-chain fatty acid transport protein
VRRTIAICLFLWLAPAAALAGPYEFFGVGARASAMGGAYSALGDDAAGLYYNVAALTQVTRFQAEIGYSYGIPNMTINGVRQNVNLNNGFNIGTVVSSLIKGHRLTIGVDVYVPDAHMMRFLEFPTDQPHSPLVANDNQTIVTLAGAGFEAARWLSIGVGVNMLASNHGGVDLQINQNAPSEGSLHSRIGNFAAPIAGLWSRPVDWLRLGLSYREMVVCRLTLPNDIHIPALTGFPGTITPLLRPSELLLWADTWSQFAPRQFEFGAAFDPHPRLTASIDLTFQQWSQMKSDAPHTLINMTGGLEDVFPTTNGPPPPAPNFHDTFNPAIGVEGRAVVDPHATLALRAGYRYRPTPVPNQTGVNNYLDSNTHVVSSGFGLTLPTFSEILPRPVSLDGFVQYHYMMPRTVLKSDPNDWIGDYKFAGQWWNFGGTITLRF